jgi:hypothetical protein
VDGPSISAGSSSTGIFRPTTRSDSLRPLLEASVPHCQNNCQNNVDGNEINGFPDFSNDADKRAAAKRLRIISADSRVADVAIGPY